MTMKSGKAVFVHAMPKMQAGFLQIAPARDEATFRAAAAAHEKYVKSVPERAATIQRREGVNAHGNRYVYLAGIDKTDDGKDIFAGNCMTWSAEKGMMALVMFEGILTMHSEVGRASERTTMEASAEPICLSVR